MIKTLLLASACVIGSGAGALQKNAPVFNQPHMQINGTNNNKTIYVDVIPNDFTKSTYNNIYQAGKTQETGNYKAFVDIEYTFVQRNGFENTTDPDYTFEDNYYFTYFFIKITPHFDYTDMKMKTSLLNNVECQVGPDMYTGINMHTYITTATKTQQIFNQYTYANTTYDPLNIFTNTEKAEMLKNEAYIWTYWYGAENQGESDRIEYENNNQSSGTNIYFEQLNDINGQWQRFRGDWQSNYIINNSRNTIYILQEYKYYIDVSPDSKTPNNPNGTNQLWTNIEFNLTTDIPTEQPTDYEVVDIGGLMFDILTMPFTFISRAFNLTLFPNTPYQINISGLFLSIFAALVFIWIIGKFIKR